jgi:hypothetical protein
MLAHPRGGSVPIPTPPGGHLYVPFDPLLSPALADEMTAICERLGSYKMYSEEPVHAGFGQGLPARYDAALNFVRSGGRFARQESPQVLAARTNYFRESYAYGEDVRAPGIEPFLHHEGFVDAARRVHGRPVIEPAIVYANLLLPGQELAVHTDVPEFRGANRTTVPQWLLVAMHHSGLFGAWRMPIATGIAYFHDCQGGELALYPDGPQKPPRTVPARHNTAVLLDTDSVFHGVDRVYEPRPDFPALRPGMRLAFEGAGRWRVRNGTDSVASYDWKELRFSVSWKAYCFQDEEERRTWREHSDDLSLEAILERLTSDLRARGRISGERPDDRTLALTIIDEYIQFPPPAGAA